MLFFLSVFFFFFLAFQPQWKALRHQSTESKGKSDSVLSDLIWAQLHSDCWVLLSLRCWTLAGRTTTLQPWTKSAASARPWTLGWAQTAVTWWSSITRWVQETRPWQETAEGALMLFLGTPPQFPRISHMLFCVCQSISTPTNSVSGRSVYLSFACSFHAGQSLEKHKLGTSLCHLPTATTKPVVYLIILA